jgi:23S rRNA (cytidine1920-2'-O)/16S rRNA (cytidine1409-2'-O)-methyltransferase
VPRTRRFVTLVARLRELHPELTDPLLAIRRGHVLLSGVPVTNPATLVPRDGSVALRVPEPLRGGRKLQAALTRFGIQVDGLVAVDVGAAAGGFTTALLHAGAARVYAVDVGHGQLRGSLRQDERVVVLERTNISALTTALVPEPVDLITVDLSYLSLAEAAPQLDRLDIRASADLVALIKPMFELGLSVLPAVDRWADAVDHAVWGVTDAGWRDPEWMRSPVVGGRGATEFLLHARRG